MIVLLLATPPSDAQPVGAGADNTNPGTSEEVTILRRGPHERVIQRRVTETMADGRVVERVGSYTELAGGLCYADPQTGEFRDAEELVEIVNETAVARRGLHRVTWAANANSIGALEHQTPGGRIVSHVIGIFYQDSVSGRSVMIAGVRDCVGAVLPPNQVWFEGALGGDCEGDIRYSYTRESLEQDILITKSPPAPEAYGLPSASTRILCLTELIEFPAGSSTDVVLKRHPDRQAAAAMVEPDLIDQVLDFGGSRFITGRAFALPEADEGADAFEHDAVPTAKSLETINGRVFLIEKLDYLSVEPILRKIPQAAGVAPAKVGPAGDRQILAKTLPPRPQGMRGRWKETQVAMALPKRPALVLDYILINANTNDVVFRKDTTTFVVGAYTLTGTTVFEGNCIVKFTNGSGSRLNIQGPVRFESETYQPCFLTSWCDNSLGESIAGSTGHPTNTCGIYLNFTGNTTGNIDVHDVRIRHAHYGLQGDSGGGFKATLRHAQLGSNYAAVVYGSWNVQNALIQDGTYAFGGSFTQRFENSTFHRLSYLRSANYTTYLTNCLVLNVSNNVSYTGACNVSNLNSSGYFQSVGNGSMYLAADSTNRNSGTTNISAGLAHALKQLTTWAPTVLTNDFATNTVLAPQVQRDTDTPDLGYHWPPLDWCWNGLKVTAALTLTNDVVVGIFGGNPNGDSYGIGLGSGAEFRSIGLPHRNARLVRFNVAQEFNGGPWTTNSTPIMVRMLTNAPVLPKLEYRFTESILPGGAESIHLECAFTSNGPPVAFRDSRFSGGAILATDIGLAFTNCVLDRVYLLYDGINTNAQRHFMNNLFRGGELWVSLAAGCPVTARNNLFDRTVIYQSGSWSHGWNAFLTNQNQLTGANPANKILTNISYETGPLGTFYYRDDGPTNTLTSLIDAGHTNAHLLGFFRHTSVPHQTPEGTGMANIGFLYLVVDAAKNPYDADGDSLYDFQEDASGNGLSDGSESSFTNPILTVPVTMTYVKGGPAKRLATNGVAFDADSLNYNGGQLTVKVTSGSEANDLLSIRNEGTGGTQIGTNSGSTVTYGGTTIGTFTGGAGTNALVVSFNTNAVNDSVQALVRNLTFQSISNAPASTNRLLAYTLTDGRGGTNAPTSQSINFICPAALDAFVVIDISQSLSTNDFATAKQSASNFVTHLSFSTDRAGLVSFAGNAYLNSPLTNAGGVLQGLILALTNASGTRFHPAFDLARTNFGQASTNTLPLMVLLSDGRVGSESGAGEAYAGEKETNRVLALQAAAAVKDAGIRVIAIAYGTNGGANDGTNLMRFFASSPNDYYYAPTISQLDSNFTAVAEGICRGFSIVTITNPGTGAVFIAPSSITVGAEASDSEGVSNVEFYNFGTNKLGETATSPYAISWTSPPFGTNLLTARAIDNLGISTTSGVVSVIVRSPPTITILNPTNGSVFAQPASLLIRAGAFDVDGSITNVQFFTNGVATAFATFVNPPYQIAWTNLAGGSYSVRAVAKDDHGLTNSSASASFTVVDCPEIGVKTLSISPSTVLGGTNTTGTITLSNAAPAGGQVVWLTSDSSSVSVPASVLVPAGATNVSFVIETTTESIVTSIVGITASSSNSASLSVLEQSFAAPTFYNQCGPMDVALIFDISQSMATSLGRAKAETMAILDSIQYASGGDYRLALVSFANDIYLNVPFSATNRVAFSNELAQLTTLSGDAAEPSDEAVNMVVNSLTESGRPRQHGSFTNGFRSTARRMIVLITDDRPSGFTNGFESGIDDVNAHRYAVDALLKGIEISALVTPFIDPGNVSDPIALSVAQDYAWTTGGIVAEVQTNEIDIAFQRIVSQCGADLGEIITVRDNLVTRQLSSIVVNSSWHESPSFPVAFDLTGVSGPVTAARVSREGRLRVDYGSHFNLEMGIRSLTSANLAAYHPPQFGAHTNRFGAVYARSGALPFSFFGDIQSALGRQYDLELVDRVSALCGNNAVVVDQPEADWPFGRTALAFKTLDRLEIAQGRCREFILNSTTNTIQCGDEWEIRLRDETIATHCRPGGWSVEPGLSGYGGFAICAPIMALTANRYEVRVQTAGGIESGFFTVVPAGAIPGAPVLAPIEIAPRVAVSNTVVTVTVSIDAPAPAQGATVTLSGTNVPPDELPSHVFIPADATTAQVTFRTLAVTSAVDYTIAASYNGVRSATGSVVVRSTSPPAQPSVMPTLLARSVHLDWSPVDGALSYSVYRSVIDCFEPFAPIATGLVATCYFDTDILVSTQYCYQVVAVGPAGTATSECEFATCLTVPEGVLRPRIVPHGGRFFNFAAVTIGSETTNAQVRYTLDGTEPTLSNGGIYNAVLRLETNSQLVAKAYLNPLWSLDDRADFILSQPTPLACNCTDAGPEPHECAVGDSLTAVSSPSAIRGESYLAARYSFTAQRGDEFFIEARSTEFDTALFLLDPGNNIVASGQEWNGGDSFLNYSARTNGSFVIEVTSEYPAKAGAFTLSFSCRRSPELDVYLDQGSGSFKELANGHVLDFGVLTTGASSPFTLRLTNSGSTNLTLTGLVVTPTNAFSLNPAVITNLAAGGFTNLTVTFTATTNNHGPISGYVSLANDDTDDDPEVDNPFVVYLEAFCNPPGVAPTVTITNLSNNQVITIPSATPWVGATATPTNTATITNVQIRVTGSGSGTIGSVANAPWRVLWTNAVPGSNTLRAYATDSGGRMGVSAPVNVLVNHRPVPTADRAVVIINSSGNTIHVLNNDLDPEGSALMVTNAFGATNGSVSFNGAAAFYTPNSSFVGRDHFQYAVADSLGARATGAVTVVVLPGLDLPDPSVALVAPTNNAEISAATNIVGSVTGNYLDFYEVSHRRRGGRNVGWTVLVTGSEPVSTGTLATFDPTQLPNGQYEIRLRAVDVLGTEVSTSIDIKVTDGPKVGQFTLAFTDLEIPVSGLPITITRSYDSRDGEVGDFGAAWTMDVASVRLEKSGIMGEGWTSVISGGVGALFQCVQETEPHVVTITFPGDTVYRFAADVSLNSQSSPTASPCTGSGGMSGAEGAITFSPLPGTVGTLVDLHAPDLLKLHYVDTNSPITFHDARPNPAEFGNTNHFDAVYDPQFFLFTTLDGRRFYFNAAGRVILMKDRHNNSLEFRNDGIIHTNSGKSVKFVRDDANRITEIYDPNGLDATGEPSGPAALQYKYDLAGNLSTVHRLTSRNATNPVYATTTFLYENAKYPHHITKIIDPRGVTGIRTEYGEDGRVKSMTDANGKTIQYVHDLANRTETIIDRLGYTNVFKYDAKGNVTESVNALGHTNRFAYDAFDRLVQTVDPLGYTNSFGYDSNGKRNAVTNALRQVTLLGFNGFGQLTSKTDALTNTTSFDYSPSGNRVAVTDALGHRTAFAHDAFGRPNAVTNALGQLRAQSGSDVNGSLQFVSEVGGLRMDFGYDANLNTTNTSFGWVNPSNGQTQNLATITEFDAAGRIVRVTDPDNQSRSTVYDEGGRVLQTVGRMGDTNAYSHDTRGNLVETRFPDGTIIRTVYDANDRLIFTVDRHLPGTAANGTLSVYDALGRVVRAERRANVQIDILQMDGVPISTVIASGTVVSASSTVYDAGNRVRFTTNAIGIVTETQYDPVGRQTALIVAQTNRTDFGYDAAGRLQFATNALGHVTQHEYDAKGRKIKTIFPDNSYVTNSYDEIGRLLAVRDVMGRTTDMEYDTRGRLKAVMLPQVFNPEGGTNTRPRFEYEYDVYGNLTLVRDAKGRETRSTYDAFGQLLSRKLPLQQTNFHVYNTLGQLAVAVDFQGQSNQMVYDALGRIATNLLFAAGSATPGRTNRFEYGPGGSYQRFIRSEGTNEIDRNIDGAVTNVFSSEGRITYEYDPSFGWLARTFTTNSDVRYGYDGLGRLATVAVHKRNGTNLPAPEVTTNTYTKLGGIENVYLPNGTRSFYEYNRLNHLTNLTHCNGAGQLLAGYAYSVGSDGQRLAVLETRRESSGAYSTNWLAWSNDVLRRLAREVSSSTMAALNYTNSYVYDLVGNRLWKTNVSGAGTVIFGYSYNTNDQLLVETSTAGGSFTNTYDANGSLTNRSSATETNWFSFDLEGRMTGATIHRSEAGQSVLMTNRYFYNAAGIRVRAETKRSVAGGAWVSETNVFLNDSLNPTGFSQVMEESAAPGLAPSVSYTLANRVLSQGKAGAASHLLPDGLGSTRLLTDSAGVITNRYTFDAFGAPLDLTNSVVNPARTKVLYGGEYHDPELNQIYLRGRYYHPLTARFGARDALDGNPTDPMSLHKYAYVQNNPVNLRDPSGNESLASISVSIGSISTIAAKYYSYNLLYTGSKLSTEGYYANDSMRSFDLQEATPVVDTATIIVHGVSAKHNGWSMSGDTPFQQNLSLPENLTPNRGVRANPLNHDFYEFNWGGFSIGGLGFVPVKSVHQMAFVHLQMAQILVSMKGYAGMNFISHSWGTTLTYDVLNSGGIEMQHWVTMGSPLKQTTDKPVWVAGNWINCHDYNDFVTGLEMYPPFPNRHGLPLPDSLIGEGLSTNPNVDIQRYYNFNFSHSHQWVHSDYWNSAAVLTHLRDLLQ